MREFTKEITEMEVRVIVTPPYKRKGRKEMVFYFDNEAKADKWISERMEVEK